MTVAADGRGQGVVAPAWWRRAWRWLPWLAMAAVMVTALAVGAGRVEHSTLDQRVTAIAGQVRCPVCEGETAAQSDTPPSVEIRAFIRSSLQKGESVGQIKSALVADYGASILERPQTRGLSLWVWVLPGLAVVAAAGALAFGFTRWRRRLQSSRGPSAEDRDLVTRALGPDR